MSVSHCVEGLPLTMLIMYSQSCTLMHIVCCLKWTILLTNVLCITETCQFQMWKLHLTGTYSVVRLDRNRHGLGILLFVESSYCFDVVLTAPCSLGLLVITIHPHNSSCHAAINLALWYRQEYRPPSSGSSFVVPPRVLPSFLWF